MNKRVITVTLNPSMDKTVTLQSLKVGGLNRLSDIRFDAGGKGNNVARILKSFGIQVTATGFIAGDIGEKIIKDLEHRGIRSDYVEVAGDTRINMKVVDLELRQTTEFNEPGFYVEPEQTERLKEKIRELSRNADLLVLGGSIPSGVGESIYGDLIRIAAEAGIPAILDAEGAAFQEGLKAVPYAVKPNLYELEQWAGKSLASDREIVEAAKQMLDYGVSIVIVSMGGDGSIVIGKDEAYRLRPFPVKVQSTVGAGDSMVAVLASGILDREPLRKLAMLTSAAGTITASKPGTEVCTFDEVYDSFNKVEIEAIF